MGVDVSVTTVAAGFTIPAEVLNDYVASLGFDDYDEADALEHLLRKRTGLTYGFAGSYYTNDGVEAWVGVNRLSEYHDVYDIPGGFLGRDATAPAPLTDDERKELKKAAKKVGLGKDVPIERFTAVLWH